MSFKPVETSAHEENSQFIDRKKSDGENTGGENSESSSFTGGQVPIPLGLNRWIYLVIGAFTVIVFGPLCMNWGEIQSLLEKEGAYKWLCDGSNDNKTLKDGVCTQQQAILTNIGITAQCLFFTGALIGGLLIDQFGPKITVIIGGVGFTLSYLLLALSAERRKTYYAYAVIQGFSVEICFYSVISIPNLFPKNRGLMLSLLGTARSASMLLCTLFNHVRSDKFTANSIGWMMAAICLALLIFVAVFTPNQPFAVTDEQGKLLEKPGKPTKKEYYQWAVTVGQPFYFLWLFCYALVFARGQFHLVSLSTQHPDVANAFGYLAGLSFVPCPILGFLVDWVGAMPVVFGLNIVGLLSYICLISGKALAAQWIAVLLLTVILSFLASQSYVIIQERYVGRLVGKLCGLVTCLGGIFAFTNLPIWSWAKLNDKSRQADIIFIGYTGVTLVTMGVMWWGPSILFTNPCFPDSPSALLEKHQQTAKEEATV